MTEARSVSDTMSEKVKPCLRVDRPGLVPKIIGATKLRELSARVGWDVETSLAEHARIRAKLRQHVES
jgi:hypothetical protein